MPTREGSGWRGVVTVNRKKVAQRSGFSRKKDAAAWEAEKKAEIKAGKLLPKGMDLLTFTGRYLDYAQARYQPKVYQEKRLVVRRIIGAWGADFNVQKVTPDLAEKYLMDHAKTRSNNAANKDRKNLLAMWNHGIRVYGLQFNPWGKTDKLPHDVAPQYTPPIEDILKLKAAASREEWTFLSCYLQTGARRSEIFRLKWDDVNFAAGTIRLGTRKTRDGSIKYRSLDMSSELADVLRWHYGHREFRDSPFVFIDGQKGPHYGKPYEARRRFVAGLCKRAKIKAFGFHALRRFVASLLADRKAPLRHIQLVLGHEKATTTDLYLYSIRQGQKETMEMLATENLLPESDAPKENGGNTE